MHETHGLLVAGTTSDAGKSVVTTGLCRAFARRGVRVAPYKAQNMSNNSMVCAGLDGRLGEIGRAQWAQARAARAAPEPAMNPVLLKPGTDRRSHVVLMGQPAGDVSSADWEKGRRHLAAAAHAAFDDLAARFDVIVAEGAGSPAEINLRSRDFVNMGLARHAGLPTVVVGDIDRGGVFAAMYGTVALLEPADQALIAGFVVNKFRGDPALLSPGLDALEKLTGRRVYGVLPWDPGLWLDSEDSLDLAGRRSRGLDFAITDHVRRGRPLLGICGGFQMLGTAIAEPHGVEADAGTEVEGLGLLDVRTDLTEEFLGGARAGNVFGTMWHGSLEGDELRGAFLAAALGREPSRVSFAVARERRFDLLGDLMERHLDVDALLGLARDGVPAGLPVLSPGGGS